MIRKMNLARAPHRQDEGEYTQYEQPQRPQIGGKLVDSPACQQQQEECTQLKYTSARREQGHDRQQHTCDQQQVKQIGIE